MASGFGFSSSHALIGGLCGSAVATSGNDWNVIIWSQPSRQHWWLGKGLLWKVLIPMRTSAYRRLPSGFCLHGASLPLIARRAAAQGKQLFWRSQMFSAGAMGLMHGTNDAQKTMGIIALTLLAATRAGQLIEVPHGFHSCECPSRPQARISKSLYGSKTFAQ